MNVLIVGGGVAALEALLALHQLARDRVDVTLLSPEPEFVFRPLTVAEPFARGHARRYDLGAIAAEFGARYVRGSFAALDPDGHLVQTAGADPLSYDVVVLAVGGRPRAAFQRTMTFGVERDPEMFNGLLADIEQGYAREVAFIVPPGVSWSLPLYELALMTAGQAAGMGMDDVHFTIVTPEERPLAMFGPRASDMIAGLLADAGIIVRAECYTREAGKDLILEPGGTVLRADRTVALPVIDGPALKGVPQDSQGFIPTDPSGRVTGLEDVYAAGDGTSFPIKQGGIATQQADAVAEQIAARAGAELDPQPFRPVLRGMLLTAGAPQYIRTNVAGGDGEGSVSPHCMWWPPTKIAGRYLAPYLTGRDQSDLMPREVGDHRRLPVEAVVTPMAADERGPRRWKVAHGQGEEGFELIAEQPLLPSSPGG